MRPIQYVPFWGPMDYGLYYIFCPICGKDTTRDIFGMPIFCPLWQHDGDAALIHKMGTKSKRREERSLIQKCLHVVCSNKQNISRRIEALKKYKFSPSLYLYVLNDDLNLIVNHIHVCLVSLWGAPEPKLEPHSLAPEMLVGVTGARFRKLCEEGGLCPARQISKYLPISKVFVVDFSLSGWVFLWTDGPCLSGSARSSVAPPPLPARVSWVKKSICECVAIFFVCPYSFAHSSTAVHCRDTHALVLVCV